MTAKYKTAENDLNRDLVWVFTPHQKKCIDEFW